jgi:hypothetical protein
VADTREGVNMMEHGWTQGKKDDGTEGERRSSRKINLDMLHQGLPGRTETEQSRDNKTPMTAPPADREIPTMWYQRHYRQNNELETGTRNTKSSNTVNTKAIYFGQKA